MQMGHLKKGMKTGLLLFETDFLNQEAVVDLLQIERGSEVQLSRMQNTDAVKGCIVTSFMDKFKRLGLLLVEKTLQHLHRLVFGIHVVSGRQGDFHIVVEMTRKLRGIGRFTGRNDLINPGLCYIRRHEKDVSEQKEVLFHKDILR